MFFDFGSPLSIKMGWFMFELGWFIFEAWRFIFEARPGDRTYCVLIRSNRFNSNLKLHRVLSRSERDEVQTSTNYVRLSDQYEQLKLHAQQHR